MISFPISNITTDHSLYKFMAVSDLNAEVFEICQLHKLISNLTLKLQYNKIL